MSLSATAKSDLLFIVVAILAAISWMFSREAVMAMPPLLFMALRFLLAGGVLAMIGHRQLRRLTKEQFWRSVRVGSVFGVGMSFWVTGLHLTTHVGEGAFIISLGVVFVPVVARLFFGESQPLTTWTALPVAMSGLALLSLNDGFRPEAGQLFFVAAAMVLAFYFILNTRAANETQAGRQTHRQKVPVFPLTTLCLLTVGVLTGIFSLVLEPWVPTFTNFTGDLVLWIVLSAVVGTAGRFIVQTWAQSLSSHSHGVVILSIEPIWVALFAAAWFGETMSLIQLGGCSLIFAALLIARWRVLRELLRTWTARTA